MREKPPSKASSAPNAQVATVVEEITDEPKDSSTAAAAAAGAGAEVPHSDGSGGVEIAADGLQSGRSRSGALDSIREIEGVDGEGQGARASMAAATGVAGVAAGVAGTAAAAAAGGGSSISSSSGPSSNVPATASHLPATAAPATAAAASTDAVSTRALLPSPLATTAGNPEAAVITAHPAAAGAAGAAAGGGGGGAAGAAGATAAAGAAAATAAAAAAAAGGGGGGGGGGGAAGLSDCDIHKPVPAARDVNGGESDRDAISSRGVDQSSKTIRAIESDQSPISYNNNNSSSLSNGAATGPAAAAVAEDQQQNKKLKKRKKPSALSKLCFCFGPSPVNEGDEGPSLRGAGSSSKKLKKSNSFGTGLKKGFNTITTGVGNVAGAMVDVTGAVGTSALGAVTTVAGGVVTATGVVGSTALGAVTTVAGGVTKVTMAVGAEALGAVTTVAGGVTKAAGAVTSGVMTGVTSVTGVVDKGLTSAVSGIKKGVSGDLSFTSSKSSTKPLNPKPTAPKPTLFAPTSWLFGGGKSSQTDIKALASERLAKVIPEGPSGPPKRQLKLIVAGFTAEEAGKDLLPYLLDFAPPGSSVVVTVKEGEELPEGLEAQGVMEEEEETEYGEPIMHKLKYR